MIETVAEYLSENIFVLEIFSVLLVLIALTYASYTDIKTRRVSDVLWGLTISTGLVLISLRAILTDPVAVLLETGLSLIIIGGLTYLIYKLRLFYGADFKAFVVIALLVPTFPSLSSVPIYDFSDPSFTSVDILEATSIEEVFVLVNQFIAMESFGFAVFVNTSIGGILFFITTAINNVRNDDFDIRKPLRSFCARKIKADEITNTHSTIIERTGKTGFISRGVEFIKNGLYGVSSDFYRAYLEWYRGQKYNSPETELNDLDSLNIETFIEESEEWFSDNLEEDSKQANQLLDNEYVWVTPGIPYIVPITFGFISALIVGNLAFVLIFLI